jgi:hypothetical protein
MGYRLTALSEFIIQALELSRIVLPVLTQIALPEVMYCLDTQIPEK